MLAEVLEVTGAYKGRTTPCESHLKLPEVIPEMYSHIGVSK